MPDSVESSVDNAAVMGVASVVGLAATGEVLAAPTVVGVVDGATVVGVAVLVDGVEPAGALGTLTAVVNAWPPTFSVTSCGPGPSTVAATW
jgi:hypothetical protein